MLLWIDAMQLIYKKKFQKSFRALPRKQQEKVRDALLLFQNAPNHRSLRRHGLKGKLKGFESIDVTGDLRIILHASTKEIVEVVHVGSHSQLYT